jgi:hypothetical protein
MNSIISNILTPAYNWAVATAMGQLDMPKRIVMIWHDQPQMVRAEPVVTLLEKVFIGTRRYMKLMTAVNPDVTAADVVGQHEVAPVYDPSFPMTTISAPPNSGVIYDISSTGVELCVQANNWAIGMHGYEKVVAAVRGVTSYAYHAHSMVAIPWRNSNRISRIAKDGDIIFSEVIPRAQGVVAEAKILKKVSYVGYDEYTFLFMPGMNRMRFDTVAEAIRVQIDRGAVAHVDGCRIRAVEDVGVVAPLSDASDRYIDMVVDKGNGVNEVKVVVTGKAILGAVVVGDDIVWMVNGVSRRH